MSVSNGYHLGATHSHRARLTCCLIMMLVMPWAAARSAAQPQKASALTASVQQQPSVKLPDGRTMLLNRLPSDAELKSLRPPVPPPLPPDTEPAPPPSVDLTADQTPVKDQGGRDTCGSFGTAAALEAAYKRSYHVNLDVSEQYLNHWGQIMAGAGSGAALPNSETNAGAIGGGGFARPLAVLTRGVGVPAEEKLPYYKGGEYQSVDPGDQPNIMSWWLPHKQRESDDFNLASAPASYVFKAPTVVNMTIMPQAALEGAQYRIKGARLMGDQQLHDLNVWRRILASRREIVMEFLCCSAPFGGSTGGGHVVLVVGYDDARQAFRIKNSWGPSWGENGYAWVSYDYVTGATVYNAAWIDEIVPPPQSDQASVWSDKQLWLGRWRMDFDGWKGFLDIYNLPSGGETARLGTLFLDDGRIFRVNGTQNGNQLTATVDWTNPNLPASQLGSTRFSLYLFSWDHQKFRRDTK